MDDREKIRRKVWAELQRVARPDSRFHWDFTAFIPDFEGSEHCVEAIRQTDHYRRARVILITPDNSLAGLRAQCLLDDKRLIVPTYAIGRGFWQIARADVPPGQEQFAATLDGLERYAHPYPLETAVPADGPALLVTGASVLSTDGIRISTGPSYFDLEWLILRALGLVQSDTLIIASVHDCQVVEWPCEPQPYDAVVDLIVTPTRTIQVSPRYPKSDRIVWEQLPWNVIWEVPILKALHQREHQP